MTDEDKRRVLANLRMGCVSSYLTDLEAYHNGDEGRFTRMVDGRGKQLGDYALWSEFVLKGLADVDAQALAPERWEANTRRAQALGLMEVDGDDVD